MARPIRDDDDVLLDRIADALAIRTSLQPWTLAEVSPAAGLSPAGLLKRFGSRHGVLVALSRRWIGSIPSAPIGEAPPWDELYSWAVARFAGADAQSATQGLTQLIDDLIDDDLRALLAEGWDRELHYVAALLTAMKLPGISDPVACGGVLLDALNGAMLRGAANNTSNPVTCTLDTLTEQWT